MTSVCIFSLWNIDSGMNKDEGEGEGGRERKTDWERERERERETERRCEDVKLICVDLEMRRLEDV